MFLEKITYESRSYVVGKFFRYDCETGRQESCVSHCFYYPYNEAQYDEGVSTLDFIQQTLKKSFHFVLCLFLGWVNIPK